MGYPVYKLLRAVNRQYPNNGFINYVDVREDMYDTNDESTNKIIDEDLRDLINETLQEVYIHVARDEVYSFPTVPGQREYSLPEDCDLRDIQEVTRTFRGWRCPPHAHDKGKAWLIFEAEDGSGSMTPIEVRIGETINLPACEFTPPEGKEFDKWMDDKGNEHNAGDPYLVGEDVTFTAVWKNSEAPSQNYIFSIRNAVEDDNYITVRAMSVTSVETVSDLYYAETADFVTGDDGTLGSNYQYIRAYFGDVLLANYDMTEVLTRHVTVNVTHPVVPPGGETPGDNNDGGEGSNPLDDLIVTPIDNGDGGYGDNPLDDDDDNNSGSGSNPAVPVVTPTGGD